MKERVSRRYRVEVSALESLLKTEMKDKLFYLAQGGGRYLQITIYNIH